MATSAFTRRITAGQAVRDIMRSLGLDTPDNVAESEDSNAVLLWFLATRAGQKLLGEMDWQFLSAEHTVTTVIGQSAYPLPPDLDRYIPDASWNRTTRLPAIGSLSEPEWQMLKARQLEGTTFTMLFRIQDDFLVFYDTPSVAQTIVLPYTSRAWVIRDDASFADHVEQDSDLIRYDRQLFAAALRLEWDTEKKFDTSASTLAYNSLLAAARGKDAPGRTLTLNQMAAYPYLGVINIPDTGYGNG